MGEDPAHIERLVTYLQRRIDEAQGTAGMASPTKIAMVAALNIADDYFRALEESRDFRREVAARSRTLLEALDAPPKPS